MKVFKYVFLNIFVISISVISLLIILDSPIVLAEEGPSEKTPGAESGDECASRRLFCLNNCFKVKQRCERRAQYSPGTRTSCDFYYDSCRKKCETLFENCKKEKGIK